MTTSIEGSGAGGLVLVLSAPTIPEGLLARGLLASEGIAVVGKGEAEGPYRVGPMELWVPAEYEVQARMILEDAASSGSSAGDA